MDSIDNRLVALLALVGVLLAIPLDTPLATRVVGSVFALAAGTCAVVGLWPRDFPFIRADRLVEGSGDESKEQVQLQVLGLLLRANEVLERTVTFKGRLLPFGLLLAVLGAAAYALGVMLGGE